MKNVIISLFAFLFSSFVLAQTIDEKDVPNIVKSTFLISYPDLTNVQWEKEKEFYKVHYIVKNTAQTMVLDPNGNVLKTATAITLKQLPATALTYIKKNYRYKKIKSVARISDAQGVVTFEVRIATKTLSFTKKGVYRNSW
jgi:predicted membrane metal-binding protein